MAYTNADIVPAALAGKDAATANGNMSTYPVDDFRARYGYTGTPVGQMHGALADLLRERFTAGKVRQVILSYQTPIAWLDAEYGWIVPVVSYSITTSANHQSKLHRLRGTYIYMPHDATIEDARRVLADEMRFTTDRKGNAIGTVPGANYTPEA